MNLPEVRPRTVARAGVLIAVIVVIGVGVTLGLELALLSFAGCVLVGVISLFWMSVRNLSGDTPLSIDEALGMGAPTAAEEQKRAVLRALKDLEFEHGVGKISKEDYLEFSARYRAEAKRLIAAVDESLGPVQQIAETLAAERLRREGLLEGDTGAVDTAGTLVQGAGAPVETAAPSAESEDDSPTAEDPENEPSKVRACSACDTENDADAVFCKRCGKSLDPARTDAVPARPVEEEVP